MFALIIKTGRRPHMKSSIPLGMNAVIFERFLYLKSCCIAIPEKRHIFLPKNKNEIHICYN